MVTDVMYHLLHHSEHCIMSTECIYVFLTIPTTNTDYVLVQC
jgi:hypothetical protein